LLVRAHCGARNLDLGRAKQPFTGRQVTVERVALDVVHLGGMHQGADGSELRDVSRGRDRIDEMEVDAGVHGHGVDVAGDTWVAGRIARGVPDSRARLCRRTAPRDGRRRNGNGATIIADRARIAECVDGLIDASLSTRGNPRRYQLCDRGSSDVDLCLELGEHGAGVVNAGKLVQPRQLGVGPR